MASALVRPSTIFLFFFFNDTATTEIYTLSLHDALPILSGFLFDEYTPAALAQAVRRAVDAYADRTAWRKLVRSEEHTSELQSRLHLVCRLLLEKKKKREALSVRLNSTSVQSASSRHMHT